MHLPKRCDRASQNNSVTYLTDDQEDYYDFLKMVSPLNNVNFGMDDSVHLVDYKGDYTKEITGMKFDLIVGNPPYEGKGKPLYLQILAALMPYAKEIVWICPSKWVLNNEDNAWLHNIKNTTLNCLIEHEHMESPFDGAALATSVGVYHFGSADKYEDYEQIRRESIKEPELYNSILEKLKSYPSKLSDHCNSDSGKKYVSGARVRGHFHGLEKAWDWYTVLGETQRNTFYDAPIDGWNNFAFDSEAECQNFVSYLDTDIATYAMSLRKINKASVKSTFSLMPWLGDYTRSWNDDQIAAELGLTKEELEYIHEEMKNFGWKCAKRAKK